VVTFEAIRKWKEEGGDGVYNPTLGELVRPDRVGVNSKETLRLFV